LAGVGGIDVDANVRFCGHGVLSTKNSLAFDGPTTDNGGMEIQGRVHHGAVILENGICLPEGAAVCVVYPLPNKTPPGTKKRIELPLVHCDRPGSVPLTNQRIAEILDAEDTAPRR
jgi:hypothetical protein